MSNLLNRKFRVVGLSMVFFVAMLLFPYGLLGQPDQVKNDTQNFYSYAEDIAENITGDDMVETLENNPVFEDAIVGTEEYIDYDFDVNSLIDENAEAKDYSGDDGYIYTVSSLVNEDGSTTTYLTSDKDNSVLEINANLDADELAIINYEPISEESDTFAINSVEISISDVNIETENPVQSAATTWNAKKALTISGILPKCGNYWYQDGVNGNTDYLKIGCDATYTLTLNGMNSTRISKCNSYKSNIKKSNDSYTASKISSAGAKITGVIATVMAALMVGGTFTAGVTTVLGIVLGVVTASALAASGVSISKFVDSAKYAYAAKDDYAIIKKY
jgi:hypothetical protein